MTRTRRIYNKPNLKKTVRLDLTKVGTKPLSEMTEGEMASYVNDSLRNSISLKGFIYHPYASGLCMGHCQMCKDPNKDQKHIRKIRKQEFRKLLKSELEYKEEIPEEQLLNLDENTTE
jgi:hypothetical protein